MPDALDPDASEPVEPRAPLPGTRRPSRSAKRIVAAVAVAVVALVGLAAWVVGGRYEVRTGGERVTCDAQVGWTNDAAGRRAEQRFDRACDDAEGDRRNVALLLGAGVAIAACAVSTVPSRRLTGEELGPLR